MTIDRINWSKLKPFAEDKRRSFEEFCYQLVELETRGRGRLTRPEGAGGDGGVEFFLELPSGEVWGWQAKFFWQPTERLTSGRKEQIKDSLAQACRKHPQLVHWTLMIPGSLTDAEEKWFRNKLASSRHNGQPVVPAGRAITLHSKGISNHLTVLRKPGAVGIRELFFGETELTPDWFTSKYRRVEARIQKKFSSILHSQTGLDENIQLMLAEGVMSARLHQRLAEFEEALEDIRDARKDVDRINGKNADAQGTLIALKAASDRALSISEGVYATLRAAHDALNEEDWRRARSLRPLGDGSDEAQPIFDAANAVIVSQCEWGTASEKNAGQWIRNALNKIRRAIQDCLDAREAAAAILSQLESSECHIFGQAGQGKTHVAAHIVSSRLEQELPAILLLGERFTTEDPIEVQIKKLLDVEGTSWDAFIAALDACARAHRTRIPIVIDGLNEATRQGALSPIWRSDLEAFCASVRSCTDSVVVVTTCRSSYKTAIWQHEEPREALELDRSTSYDVRDALRKYFDHYRIVADPTIAPLAQFQHPIYLRLFCEATNPTREEPKHIVLGEETLFVVFDRYIEACNQRVVERLDRPPRTLLVEPALVKLAKALWDSNTRYCNVEDAYQLIDGKKRRKVREADSLMAALQHEDILIFRDWGRRHEIITFTYDLIAGYEIALYLAGQARPNPARFFKRKQIQEKLFGEYGKRHPLAEDIVRCLAALAPSVFSKRLDEIVDQPIARRAAVRCYEAALLM